MLSSRASAMRPAIATRCCVPSTQAFCSPLALRPLHSAARPRRAATSTRPPRRAVSARRPRACAAGGSTADDDGGDDGQNQRPLDMSALARRMREVEDKASRERARSGRGRAEEEEDEDEDEEIEFTVAYDEDIMSAGEGRAEGVGVDEDSLRMLNDQFDALDKLYVILFDTKGAEEGVYSLALDNVNIVLAFQEKEEALRYALMLGVQDFPQSKVSAFGAAELKKFCADSGFRLGLVPKGSRISPPDETVDGNLEDWMEKTTGKLGAAGSGLSGEDIESERKKLEGLFGSGSGDSFDGKKNCDDKDEE